MRTVKSGKSCGHKTCGKNYPCKNCARANFGGDSKIVFDLPGMTKQTLKPGDVCVMKDGMRIVQIMMQNPYRKHALCLVNENPLFEAIIKRDLIKIGKI